MSEEAAADRFRLYARLERVVAQLNADELHVLVLLGERAVQGRGVYGALEVAADRRVFHLESLEEITDGLFYLGAALVRLEGRGG